MATKPTDRILDWASGGSTTDPGGAKEAAGWLTSERPPANWWNWILNSFGQWLSYSEDVTDEIETRLAEIKTNVDDVVPVSILKLDSGTSGSITRDVARGEDISTVTLASAGEGDSGGLVNLTYPANTFTTAPIMLGTAFATYPLVSGEQPLVITQQFGSTSVVKFTVHDGQTGTIIDIDDIGAGEDFKMNVAIYGKGSAAGGI